MATRSQQLDWQEIHLSEDEASAQRTHAVRFLVQQVEKAQNNSLLRPMLNNLMRAHGLQLLNYEPPTQDPTFQKVSNEGNAREERGAHFQDDASSGRSRSPSRRIRRPLEREDNSLRYEVQESGSKRRRSPSREVSSSPSLRGRKREREHHARRRYKPKRTPSPSSSPSKESSLSSSSSSDGYSSKSHHKRRRHDTHRTWKRSRKLQKFKEGGKIITFQTYDGSYEATDKVENSTRASLGGIFTHRHFEKKVKPQGEEVLPSPKPVELEEAHSLYFDGAYKRIIDKAAAGVVVFDEGGEKVFSTSELLKNSHSNNEAEYAALILGLEWCVNNKIHRLNIYGDAMLLVKQIKGIWACKNHSLLNHLKQVKELMRHFQAVEIHHVPRMQNQEADALASEQLLGEVVIGAIVLKEPLFQGSDCMQDIVDFLNSGECLGGLTKGQRQWLARKATSEQGHSYRTCPQKHGKKEPPRTAMNDYCSKRGSPLCYAWGKVREHDALILFDSGSAHNYISVGLASKLGIHANEMGETHAAEGPYEGPATLVTPLIRKLRLHVQGYVDKEDFLISPLKNEDVLLGVPWFDCMAASLPFLERKVTFKHKDRDITLHVNEKGHTIPLVSHDSFDKAIKSSIFAYMIFVKDPPLNSNDVSPNGSLKVDNDLHLFLNEHVELFVGV
ncbi:hypothetical protein L7F22_033629 [Adiantum nelumboides]|nr:hypothetical protein [Adiantum nelumboides]